MVWELRPRAGGHLLKMLRCSVHVHAEALAEKRGTSVNSGAQESVPSMFVLRL